jgi:cysteine desulfurase
MHNIYLDNIATTPLHPTVLDAMMPFLGKQFGNPSSLHRGAAGPRAAVERARGQVASMIGCDSEEVVFTSGASEANNLAVKGAVWGSGRGVGRVLVSAIEHLSVLNAARRLGKMGYEAVELPVDRAGLLDPDDVRAAVGDGALMLSVNLVNPEIGTVEPVAAIAEAAREKGIPFHCDATAAGGWLPIDVNELGVDFLTLSAHNFYGPKGAGALYVKGGRRLVPLVDGGPQEGGLRGGTENVAGVVGMGAAAELAIDALAAVGSYLPSLRDTLIERLTGSMEGAVLTGHERERAPGHASFCIKGIEGEALLTDLDAAGIAAASGSACSTRALKISHVLEAIGVDAVLARGAVAFTIGRDAREADVEETAAAVISSVARLREMSPL